MLLGADAVDGQLQRARTVRRPPQLVVDQAERAVGKEVEAIDFPAQPDGAGAGRGCKCEFATQIVLEQTLDDGHGPLGLHAQDRLTKPGRGRRSEQTRAFESGFSAGQLFERVVDNFHEQRPCAIEIARRNGAATGRLPAPEKRFKYLVEEPPLPFRIHHLFVFGFVV